MMARSCQVHKDEEEPGHGDIQYFTCLESEEESQGRNTDQSPRAPLVAGERITFSDHHGGHLRAISMPADI